MSDGEESSQQQNATLLLRVDVVDLYEIQGAEKTLIGTGDLNVLQAGAVDEAGEDVQIVFFAVGDFTCPLAKHIPCLRMGPRYYVFPLPGKFYGVQLPESTPDEAERELDFLLETHGSLRRADGGKGAEWKGKGEGKGKERAAEEEVVEESEEVKRARKQAEELAAAKAAARKLEREQKEEAARDSGAVVEHKPQTSLVTRVGSSTATGIEVGSKAVATGVRKSAATIGAGMQWGSRFLISKLKPKDKPTEVSTRVQGNIQKAKMVSGVAVKVSATLVQGVMAMTSQIANEISSEIKKTDAGKRLDSKLSGESGQGMKAAKDVAVAGLVAFTEINAALFDAGTLLLDNAGKATADVVDHRYGEDAGHATREAMSVATSTAQAAKNMSSIGVKAIARATVKETAINVVVDDETKAARAKRLPPPGGVDAAAMNSMMMMSLMSPPEPTDPNRAPEHLVVEQVADGDESSDDDFHDAEDTVKSAALA